MNVAELKGKIMSNTLNSFYVFTGEEWKIQDIYLNQISKTTGKRIKRVDSVANIFNQLTNSSFIRQSFIYVVRDDKELMTNEKLQNQLCNILKDNILVLIVTTLDKRLKFVKTYKDIIVEFEVLNKEILRRYIDKEIKLSVQNCDKLMEVCGYNYGGCLLEIDKINQCIQSFSNENNNISEDKMFITLLSDGTIHQPPKDAIFDFVDAILDCKVNRSYELYKECVDCGEAVMVMITVLYNNAKAVLQVQNCTSSDIENSTGLTYWQIKNASKHKNVYHNSELIRIMELCYECQRGIVTGTISEELVIPYILAKILT